MKSPSVSSSMIFNQCSSCNNHLNCRKFPSVSFLSISWLQPQATIDLLSVTIRLVWPTLEFHINQIIWHVLFSLWFLSLSRILLHMLVVCSCLRLNSISLYWYTTIFFVYLPIDKSLKIKALWTFIYKSFLHIYFQFFWVNT